MKAEYGHHRPQSHSFLSNHFWNSGYGSGKTICLDHGHNHSLFKLLALQALHGWEQYIVVFKTNPTPADAKAYCEAGLVFCTEKTVHRLLASIDLCAHGVPFPFPFAFLTKKYSVTVQPDLHQTVESRHARFEAVIAAEHESIRVSAAESAADVATGILPF